MAKRSKPDKESPKSNKSADSGVSDIDENIVWDARREYAYCLVSCLTTRGWNEDRLGRAINAYATEVRPLLQGEDVDPKTYLRLSSLRMRVATGVGTDVDVETALAYIPQPVPQYCARYFLNNGDVEIISCPLSPHGEGVSRLSKAVCNWTDSPAVIPYMSASTDGYHPWNPNSGRMPDMSIYPTGDPSADGVVLGAHHLRRHPRVIIEFEDGNRGPREIRRHFQACFDNYGEFLRGAIAIKVDRPRQTAVLVEWRRPAPHNAPLGAGVVAPPPAFTRAWDFGPNPATGQSRHYFEDVLAGLVPPVPAWERHVPVAPLLGPAGFIPWTPTITIPNAMLRCGAAVGALPDLDLDVSLPVAKALGLF